jgi:magnesium-transporting ATPase (P-type)
MEDQRRNVLGARLAALLRQSFPVAAAGGAIIAGIGLLRGAPLLAQLTLGTSVVLAAVPEGLPLLTGLGQAATARRLAREHVVVRRLASVETLGRVDIACVDKTGTLTRGQLAVRLVASLSREALLTAPADSAGSASSAAASVSAPIIDESLRDILRAAALASPHPDVWNVASHPTDVAVIRGAERAGLGGAIRATRERESPFDPTRAFHAATVDGHVYVKGALEVLLDRCVTVRRDGADRPLDDATREEVVALGHRLAERGLRVLLVGVGSGSESPGDPRDLTALGFVALSDPLREDVPAVVERCHEAGVRVMMLTGDHPVTAQTIAREAGLLDGRSGLLTGTEMAELDDDALSARLESATVIARATPLDKLRIVESLQRRGHVVAMTGDGVNDAPALRLADVGVAMGKGGTEVARQAADIVLLDDDFATLVSALVEGRAFWRSTRRALGILLGGNLGELGLMLGASAFGEAAPLSVRQILAVNLVTDLLPAIVLAVQGPPKRRLAELSREGAASLDAPLRRTIGFRTVATALPSLATYLLTGGAGSGEAQSAAFASVVTTQLAQTLVSGTSDRRIAPPVAAAVGVSGALVVGGFALPAVRSLLGLTPLSPFGWTLVAGSTLAAPMLHRLLAAGVPIGGVRSRIVRNVIPATCGNPNNRHPQDSGEPLNRHPRVSGDPFLAG